MNKLLSPIAFFSSIALSASAHAANYVGMAKPWQLGLQEPATPVMEKLFTMHNDFLLPLITVISIFVLFLLIYICVRFHHKRNPNPSKVTHNTKLEIIWTIIPIFILVVVAIPSLRLHYFMQRPVDTQLTVKVTGYQWYWHYDYPDNGGFGFDSYIKKGADLKPGDVRQLAVDNAMVVPVNTKVRVQITGADVIHSWAVPAFGVKKDAVPGRLNESWFEATKIGTFYGQCSQLCGVGHGFMPVAVQVVSKEDFANWVKSRQKESGAAPAAAAAEPSAPAPATPSKPASSLPQAKPQNLATTPNAAPVQKEEKARAKVTGQGKPAGETPPQGRTAQPDIAKNHEAATPANDKPANDKQEGQPNE
jgi:cytochrome c oxidase subunit 2